MIIQFEEETVRTRPVQTDPVDRKASRFQVMWSKKL